MLRRIFTAPGSVGVDDRGVRTNPVFARATALINVRPLRTHAWSGLGTCLKNYIMFVPRIALDGKYTVFGRVISGMQAVDGIAQGEPPAEPTRIVRATIGG